MICPLLLAWHLKITGTVWNSRTNLIDRVKRSVLLLGVLGVYWTTYSCSVGISWRTIFCGFSLTLAQVSVEVLFTRVWNHNALSGSDRSWRPVTVAWETVVVALWRFVDHLARTVARQSIIVILSTIRNSKSSSESLRLKSVIALLTAIDYPHELTRSLRKLCIQFLLAFH